MTPVVEAKCQLTGSIVILAPFRQAWQMMLDDAEACQLSGPIGELVPFSSTSSSTSSLPDPRPIWPATGDRSSTRWPGDELQHFVTAYYRRSGPDDARSWPSPLPTPPLS
jgi:hypothetical protein